MKNYKRVIACVVLANLIISGISECAGVSTGRFPLISPVLASERFTWGAVGSTESDSTLDSSSEAAPESENFTWGMPEDDTEEASFESVEQDSETTADTTEKNERFQWPSDINDNSKAGEVRTDESTSENASAKAGSLTEQAVDVYLYQDAEKQRAYIDREVSLSIEGLLPENCTIDAYPIIFNADGLDVIESWDITIYDRYGEVYEPGDYPVKVTITSRALRNLPAGQIEIYHITEQTEKSQNVLNGSIDAESDNAVSTTEVQKEENDNSDQSLPIKDDSVSDTNRFLWTTEKTDDPEQGENQSGLVSEEKTGDPEQSENQSELVSEEKTGDSEQSQNRSELVNEEDSDNGLGEDELIVNDDAELIDDSLYESGNIISPNQKLDIVAEDGAELALEPLGTMEIADTEDSITFEMKEFSGVAVVRLNAMPEELLGAGPSTDVAAIDTSEIIDINMFNYTAYDERNVGSGNNINLSDDRIKRGINIDSNGNFRDFRFYSSGVKSQDTSTPRYYFPYSGDQGTQVTPGQYNDVQTGTNGYGWPTYTRYWIPILNQLHSINNYTGGHRTDEGAQSTPVPMQGIVQNQLYDNSGQAKSDGTGYPYLAYGAWQGNYNDVGTNPAYSAGNPAASLQYLFDPEMEVNGKTSYTGVNYLFYDKDGYYTYDSKEYYAYLQNNNEFMLLNSLYKPGFFPFNPYTDQQAQQSVGPGKGYDDHFGMTLSAKFTIPLNGKLSDGRDEQFIFSGDDDLWLFIDGKLVLDIGGVHQPIYGSINFATGEVIVNPDHGNNVATVNTTGFSPVTQTSLKQILGPDFNKDPYHEHVIQVFYLERGSNDSNLKVQFNLPMMKSVDVSKHVTGEDADYHKGDYFKFQLYLQDLRSEELKYDKYNPYTTDENIDVIDNSNVANPETNINGYHANAYPKKLKFYIGVEDESNPGAEIVYTELRKSEIEARFDRDGTFKLKHNEHLKIGNMIEYQKYYVQELLDGERFETSANGNVSQETQHEATVDNNPTAAFENRPIKKKINVEKDWDDEIPFDYLPDSIKISVKQKDYVKVHFTGSSYDSLAKPVRIPKGESFSFDLSLVEEMDVDWDQVKVYANNTQLSTSSIGDVRTFTVPGQLSTESVSVSVEILSRVVDYSSNDDNYTKLLKIYPVDHCVNLTPIEHVILNIAVQGAVYNDIEQDYELVDLEDLGGDYSLLKTGGDSLSIATADGIGFNSIIGTELFSSSSEQDLPGSTENLKSSGNYSFAEFDGDKTLTIQLKGGEDTTIDDLKQALTTLSLGNSSGEPIGTYSMPDGSVSDIPFTVTKPENATTPWKLNIIDPRALGELAGHYYEYEIDEISVVKDGQTMSLADAGYKMTVTDHNKTEEFLTGGSRIGAHVENFKLSNKFKDVDITLIKTSSVELPQQDGTHAYELLPGVEFTLYEKTVKIVEGESTDVLTPIDTTVVSADDPEEAEPSGDPSDTPSKKGKIVFRGLKRGKTYYLEETKAAEGYCMPGTGWTIAVGFDGKVTITGQDNYESTYELPTEGALAGSYQIKNVKLYELPSTGGPGDYLFTIIGISISFAIVLLKLRELKEERAA